MLPVVMVTWPYTSDTGRIMWSGSGESQEVKKKSSTSPKRHHSCLLSTHHVLLAWGGGAPVQVTDRWCWSPWRWRAEVGGARRHRTEIPPQWGQEAGRLTALPWRWHVNSQSQTCWVCHCRCWVSVGSVLGRCWVGVPFLYLLGMSRCL